MHNFDYFNPTRVIFGSDIYQRIPEQIKLITPHKKVLLTYGGGSIKKTGIYDEVVDAMKGFEIIPFGGIEPNPEYDTLMKAVDIAKNKQVDFILAVGGGSVIDGTKFIAAATKYDGNPWDVLSRKEGCSFTDALPFGTVLTIPATGSEMNSGAVISHSPNKEKLTMGGPITFPRFSFLDPKVVSTLPKRQLANGITDAYMHVMEQYLTYPTDNFLQERIAEGILITLREIAVDVIANPSDHKLASNLMWCATMALNGTLRAGVVYDWATHMIGHELTALFGIDHARTLAIIGPNLYKVKVENKREKLIQYGERVLGLKNATPEEAIRQTKLFFESIGISTQLSTYTSSYQDAPQIIKNRFEERGWTGIGERADITPEEVEKIVALSFNS